MDKFIRFMDPILKEDNAPLKDTAIEWLKTFLKHERVGFRERVPTFLRYLIESMEEKAAPESPTPKLNE